MKTTYFVTVYENLNKEWRYICTFPDFDNMATEENTLDKLTVMAEEILQLKIYDMQSHHFSLPQPSVTYDELCKKADKSLGPISFIMPITVSIEAPILRISMTVPADKLDTITQFAKQINRSRSALMIDATLEYIKKQK